MAVKYVIRDNELVSVQWAAALDAITKRGVDPIINEGHRTFARQQYFWNGWVRRLPGFNLAAFPSPWAPHIRTGRFDHALDLGNAADVHRELGEIGISSSWTVPGESWHLEANASQLGHYFTTHGQDSKYDVLPRHVKRAVKSFFMARNQVRSLIKRRDKVDSKARPKAWLKLDAKVDRAVGKRARKRRKLERMHKRAKDPKTRRILGGVLA